MGKSQSLKNKKQIMELNPSEQNQVALYLFNSIEIEVKKKYK